MSKNNKISSPICGIRRSGRCLTAPERKCFGSLEEIVSDYIEKCRIGAQQELLLFTNLETLETAVEFAGLARCPGGGKFHHQFRIPPRTLEKSKSMLAQLISKIRNCLNFEELFNLMKEKIKDIPGIGELTIYDTALRIGANLGIEPKLVYLHRGTKVGAKALGKVWEINIRGRNSLNRSELPGAFSKLSPREIEDCLCVYKKDIETIMKQRPGRHPII